MKAVIRTHRFVLGATWLFILMWLLVFPGFEVRGLAFGLIIGYWPFALLGELGDATTLLLMFVLSASEVGLCAWLIDKRGIPRKTWAAVWLAVIFGAVVAYIHNADYFDTWKLSLISQIMPEGYELTMADFRRLYLIPKTIVGGMIGLYVAIGLEVIYAAGSMLYKKMSLCVNAGT